MRAPKGARAPSFMIGLAVTDGRLTRCALFWPFQERASASGAPERRTADLLRVALTPLPLTRPVGVRLGSLADGMPPGCATPASPTSMDIGRIGSARPSSMISPPARTWSPCGATYPTRRRKAQRHGAAERVAIAAAAAGGAAEGPRSRTCLLPVHVGLLARERPPPSTAARRMVVERPTWPQLSRTRPALPPLSPAPRW